MTMYSENVLMSTFIMLFFCSMDFRPCSNTTLCWFLLLLFPKVIWPTFQFHNFHLFMLWVLVHLSFEHLKIVPCSWKNNKKLHLPAWVYSSVLENKGLSGQLTVSREDSQICLDIVVSDLQLPICSFLPPQILLYYWLGRL